MQPLPAKIYRENSFGPAPGQALVNGLFIFLGLCSVLYFGRDVLVPVALAVLLAVLLAPLVRFLQKIRLPRPAAVVLVVALAFVAIFVLAAVVATTVTNLASDLPAYESSLREKAKSLRTMTSGSKTMERAANVLQDLRSELDSTQAGARSITAIKPVPVEVFEPGLGPFDSVIAVVAVLVHPLTQLGIVILMVTFILLYREDLRNRLIRLAGTDDIHRTTIALDEAGNRLGALFAMQLLLNGITGIFIGVAMFVIGVPGAILWGVLTAILRFVPFVGTILASVLPVIIAVAVGDGWTLALIAIGIVLLTEIVVGQILEPLLFGKTTGLSPTAIVAAAAFWTALWGPIGLVLATPLTIALLVVGRHIEALKFLEVLLGSKPVLTPDHAFYQRMLAGDPIEAAEQAQTYEEQGELAKYLSEVAVPGLLLAQFDKSRDVLSPDREVAVVASFAQVLEELWPAGSPSQDTASPVALISAHGALNFAAMLAVSAFLRLKNIPHRLLPQDSISPGKFPENLAAGVSFVCLCYLIAPTPAKFTYLQKRVASRLPEARILGVAWKNSDGEGQTLSPDRVGSMLPGEATHEAGEGNRAEPAGVEPMAASA